MALPPTKVPTDLGQRDERLRAQQHKDLLTLFFDIFSRVSSIRPLEGAVRTTDATVTTLLTIPLTDDRTTHIVIDVVARRTGGSSGTAGDGASYRIIGAFNRVSAGSAAIIGSLTADHTAEDQSGWDCTLTASGDDVLVRVTGASGNNISWGAIVTLQEI